MLDAEAAIVVGVPLEVVYRAVSDLAHFPLFMVATREVAAVGGAPGTYRWVARSGLRARRWDITLCNAAPSERVIWRSQAGGVNTGAFALEPLGDQTRVTLHWACDQPWMDPAQAVCQSLANLKRAVETGQSQIRPLDPLLVVSVVTAVALIAGALVGLWLRSTRERCYDVREAASPRR
ncbi:MAG: SRPBCC family protein [Ktedonobacterales bacterium]